MAGLEANNKRIARNTFFLYARMGIVLIITLYTTRVLLSSLGEIDFGVNNVVAGAVSMFSFLNVSLSACIQRFYNYEHGESGEEGMNRVYNTSCIIQFLLAVFLLILLETIGIWYMNNILVVPEERFYAARVLFQCTIFSLMIVVIQVPFSSAIMAYERMDYFAFVGVLDVFLKLAIAFIVSYYRGDKLILYGVLLAIVSVVDFLLYFVYVKRKFCSLSFHLSFNKVLFMNMLSFAGWSMFGSFAMVMRNQGLSMIMNAFLGPVVNAARGISYQIKGGLVGFINNISTATRPQVVEAFAQGNYKRSEQLTFASTKICFYLLYVMALPVAYEINFILELWLGDSIPENTAIFSILILVIALIDGFNPPITTIIYATGKNGLYNVLTGLGGLLVLPLSYWALIENMHPLWVYVASIFVSIVVQAISIWCLKREVGISIKLYLREVVLPCLLVTASTILLPYFVVKFINPSFIRLVVTTLVSVVFVGILSYFVGLNNNERMFVKLLLNKIIRRNN